MSTATLTPHLDLHIRGPVATENAANGAFASAWDFDLNMAIIDSAIYALQQSSGGTSVLVNGSSISNPNFNNSAPAAPGGFTNVVWQVSGASVSAYVPSIPASLPPSGAAGGDLSGTYPNPTVARVNGAAVPTSKTVVGTNSSGQIVDASSATLSNNTTGTAANLSGTPALPNGTTATTQVTADNSTKLATTAYVQAQGYATTSQLPQTIGAVAHQFLTSYTAATGVFTQAQPSISDLGASTAPVNISMAPNRALTFTWTTASPSAMQLANSTAATSGLNQSSPSLNINGNYWTGSASAGDGWRIQDVLGTGANPTSTLTITQTGSTGAAAVSVPNLSFPVSGVLSWFTDTGLSRDNAGVVDVGNGTAGDQSGTLIATLINALTGFQIGGAAASGNYLRGNGTDFVSSTIQAADVPTLNQNTTGTASNLSGTPALPNGTTATTQAAGDNSNQLATDAFVLGQGFVTATTAPVTSVFTRTGAVTAAANDYTLDQIGASQTVIPTFNFGTLNGDLTFEWAGTHAVGVKNTTAATVSADKNSARLLMAGNYWTGAASATDTYYLDVEFGLINAHHSHLVVRHVAGTTSDGVFISAGMQVWLTGSSSGQLSVAANSTATEFDVSTPISATTGFRIGGAATSGHVLRGNGTNFVDAALAAADLSNGVTGSGTVMLSVSPATTGTLSAAAITATGTVQGATLTSTGAVNAGTNKGVWNSSGVITTYNNIATVSNGVPAEYATVDLTAQSAAITATTAYAVTVTGMYRVSWTAAITTAGGTSVLGGANGFQVIYTSPTDSVVKTTVPGNSTTSSANTTGTAVGGCEVVYVKAGTNIQYTMGYTSTGAAMVYELHIKVEAM